MRLDIFRNRFQAAGTTGFGEPFALDGANAVVVQLATVVGGSLTSASLVFSDDLENWHSEQALTAPATAPNVAISPVVGLGAPYCRLKFTTSTASILNASINTIRL